VEEDDCCWTGPRPPACGAAGKGVCVWRSRKRRLVAICCRMCLYLYRRSPCEGLATVESCHHVPGSWRCSIACTKYSCDLWFKQLQQAWGLQTHLLP
jgi:hypothetical protein